MGIQMYTIHVTGHALSDMYTETFTTQICPEKTPKNLN